MPDIRAFLDELTKIAVIGDRESLSARSRLPRPRGILNSSVNRNLNKSKDIMARATQPSIVAPKNLGKVIPQHAPTGPLLGSLGKALRART